MRDMPSPLRGASTARVLWCIFATALLLTGLAASAARAADEAVEFFRGKRLTYLVPTKPGGGYDTYARLIARHLPKHLPVTAVQVRNVPGAGHLIGLRQLAAAPADGLTLGTLNTGLIYAQIRQQPEMNVDLRTLSWVGKASSDPRVLVVGKQTGLSDMAGLRGRERPLLLAGSGKTSAAGIEMELVAHALAIEVKPVYGFAGPEAELAILRGDVDGMLGAYSSLRGFVEQGHGRVLLRIGDGADGLDGVPELGALVDEPAAARVAALIGHGATLGRLTAAPPGVPAERLAALRSAYLRTLADPELLREAHGMKLPIDALDGAGVELRIHAALADPASVAPLLGDFTPSD